MKIWGCPCLPVLLVLYFAHRSTVSAFLSRLATPAIRQRTPDSDNRKTTHYRASFLGEYIEYWDQLLAAERREQVNSLRIRRSTWSRQRLEQAGLRLSHCAISPESEMFGEKLVRVQCQAVQSLSNRYARGDVVLVTPTYARMRGSGRRSQSPDVFPKECTIVDVSKDAMTLAVGGTWWPPGLFESRKLDDEIWVQLDATAPIAPLKAQRKSLDLLRRRRAGIAAELLAESFVHPESCMERLSDPPKRLSFAWNETERRIIIAKALSQARAASKTPGRFRPNKSQREAIEWALNRQVSLIQGPAGTGKSLSVAMLIGAALQLPLANEDAPPNRVLAVAHSNGAADVLLEALIRIGIPAVRAGRPVAVSESVRCRTATALAERHPDVIRSRQRLSHSQSNHADLQLRASMASETSQCIREVAKYILDEAPVVVASCIGALQLLEDGKGRAEVQSTSDLELNSFSLVVVDEAAQTTEPALLCALATARAEQVVLVGDTKQLPPTVSSEDPKLRESLGRSPMARLEAANSGQKIFQIQYRMHPALLEHPSEYFYEGKVKCARGIKNRFSTIQGFPWPDESANLAFVHMAKEHEVLHTSGGKSNPSEANMVIDIALGLLDCDDRPPSIAVISPYSNQVQSIRSSLVSRNINEDTVRVGTVDAFQGQEVDVVVFSAVRSNSCGELGFLRDARRLCVAITRAKLGLIIVGNANVLRTSRHWSALIDSCQTRGYYMDEAEIVKDQSEDGKREDISSGILSLFDDFNDSDDASALYDAIALSEDRDDS